MPPHPRRVGLQHIDGARLEHAARVVERVAVFARGDVHRGGARSRISATRQGRRTRPAPRTSGPPGSREVSREMERLLDRKRAVGVHEKRAIADRRFGAATRSGSRSGSLPIFIFTQRQPSRSTQPASWSCKLVVRVGGEAAAAVDRHGVAAAAEKDRERQAEQLGLQVPQRRVDRRDGGGGQSRRGRDCGPRAASPSRQPACRRCHAPRSPRRATRSISGTIACVGVGVAKSRLAAGLDVDHDIVVASQAKVPSASGPSVGIV